MEGGPPNFPPGSSCRAVLRQPTTARASRSATGLSPSSAPRPRGVRVASRAAPVGPTTPRPPGPRFGLRPFRSPLLRASRLIPLPPGTEMFQFPGFASPFRVMTSAAAGRVSPFGHPGLLACVPLPPAYRRLPRPSSPPCAQASPTGRLSLDHHRNVEASVRTVVAIQASTSHSAVSCRPRPPLARRSGSAEIHSHSIASPLPASQSPSSVTCQISLRRWPQADGHYKPTRLASQLSASTLLPVDAAAVPRRGSCSRREGQHTTA